MILLRSFLALLAGYLTMAVIVVAATTGLGKFAPSWVGAPGSPRPAYMIVNLAYSLIAAMVSGYITALIGHSNPLIHAMMLAFVVLLFSALSALQQRGKQPIWYQLTLMAIMPIGVITGGLLRLHVFGV